MWFVGSAVRAAARPSEGLTPRAFPGRSLSFTGTAKLPLDREESRHAKQLKLAVEGWCTRAGRPVGVAFERLTSKR